MALTIGDDIDVHLVRLLQDDATRPLHELGAIVGLSAAAVQRRISKLKRSGVITRTAAIVDQNKAGLPITIVTFVMCERDGPEWTLQMRDRLGGMPEALHCYELAGTSDLVAIFVVPSMDRYKELAEELFVTEPNVKRFETHVVLHTVKDTQALPV